MHNMHEEEARMKMHHEEMRKAIRVEWERHQVLERDKKEIELREKGLDAASLQAEERRRLLMTTKIQAKRRNPPYDSTEDVHQNEPTTQDRDYRLALGNSMPLESRQRTSASTRGRLVPPSSLNHRIRSVAVGAGYGKDSEVSATVSVVSSLLDDDEDGDDDDEMEEILLR